MKINKKINYFIALLVIFLIFWFRFIREKLPRDIPLEINLISLFLMILLCFMYSFNIFKYFFCKNTVTTNIFNIQQMLQRIITPILINIESYNITNNYFEKFIAFFQNNYKQFPYKILYVFFELLPRITLFFIFILDVFVLNQLLFFYKAIWLILFPILIGCLLIVLDYRLISEYSLIDQRTELYCSRILKEPDSETTLILPAQELVHEQSARILLKLPLMPVESFFRSTYIKQIRLARNLPDTYRVNVKAFNDQIYKAINYCISLNLVIFLYKKEKAKMNSFITLFINIGYLLAWTYILIISFHTLDPLALSNLLSWLPINDGDNPFI